VAKTIFFDITRLLGRYFNQRHPTGIDRVSLEYLRYYLPVARVMLRWCGRSGLFSNVVSQKVIGKLLNWDYTQRNQIKVLLVSGVWSAMGAGDAHGAIFLHTNHNEAESSSFWRNIAWHHMRPVFFIHDLIPLTHPEFCRIGEPVRHQKRIDCMLNGAAIVVNSQYTLSEFQQYTVLQQRILPPTYVALLAPPNQFSQSHSPQQIPATNEDGRSLLSTLHAQAYFVMLGTIEPRKNHALLLDVWRYLTSNTSPNTPHLVVIGQPGWHSDGLESMLRDKNQFNKRVHWITNCSDSELQSWLVGAKALLFPSFAEGFGMPIAEALSLGTPVIASDLEVFKEFAGDIPLYLSPSDVKTWCGVIEDFAKPVSALRATQCQRMQGLQLPTWKMHFRQVDRLLADLDIAMNCNGIERVKKCVDKLQKKQSIAAEIHGFSWRKKQILLRYLNGMGIRPDSASFNWGASTFTKVSSQTEICVEDGFIRSIGLGADLSIPLSLVFDTRGIYFNATRPSDLEYLLQNKSYSEMELARAVTLREQLIQMGLTKYNLAAQPWQRPAGKGRVILVVGQVETDASIRLGAHELRTNAQLLQMVRHRCPDAYIVYKPHPDVLAGMRAGKITSLEAQQWADEVIEHADTATLFNLVDEVHVITSLMGFEALLRGIKVTVYGAPFYAGWGLCEAVNFPMAVAERRTRKLSLDQLVAASLIDYPVYFDPLSRTVTSPEHVVRILAMQRHNAVAKAPGLKPTIKQRVLAKWAQLQGRF
jgi:glycosyltransferase involved in cell wall biosynthesis